MPEVSTTPTTDGTSDREIPWLLLLCGFYLVVEIIYVIRLPLVMDEFAGAREIWRLTSGMPYRDFVPYKTVLGYYIQLPALMITDDLFAKMISVKIEMALINTVCLVIASKRLCRIFPRSSVLAALALLVVMSTFLERSSELRVDMLTAWFGLFSLIFLLEKRLIAAAVACSLSFFVSQKGIYYCAAGTAALLVRLMITRQREDFTDLLKFIGSGSFLAVVYFAVFTLPSSPDVVAQSILVAPRQIAIEPLYEIRGYWLQTFLRNPLFCSLALLGAVIPLAFYDLRSRIALIAPYSISFFGFCLWHKQPWPYFFVIPAVVAFVCLVVSMDVLIPRWSGLSGWSRALTGAAIVLLGLLLPLSRVDDNLRRDNSYQHKMVELGEAILGDDGTYLAGFPLLYPYRQSPPEMAWIDGTKSERLERMAEPELRALAERITADPPKFVFRNYRIVFLPQILQRVINSNFQHFWGNLYTYSPEVKDGILRIHHEGRYILRDGPSGGLLVDGTIVGPGEMIHLDEGVHHAQATDDARLLLFPEAAEPHLDSGTRRERIFFLNVYTY